MKNPGLPKRLWKMLSGRLWHSTSIDGFAAIIGTGEIRLMPAIRYRENFCRSEGCVSLFDLGRGARDDADQFRNWSGFFGRHYEAAGSIWLEIDRRAVSENLSDAHIARERWRDVALRRRLFIPDVEACHRGPIPLTAVIRAIGICDCDRDAVSDFGGIAPNMLSRARYWLAQCPQPPFDPLVEAIRARRRELEKPKP